MVRQLEAGGTPVRTNGMVTGVMLNGSILAGTPQAGATMRSAPNLPAWHRLHKPPAAPQPDEPAGPPVARRSEAGAAD